MVPLGKAKRLVIKPGKVENRKTGKRKPERVKNRNEEKKKKERKRRLFRRRPVNLS